MSTIFSWRHPPLVSSGVCIFVLHAHQLLSHCEFLFVLLLKSNCLCFSDIGCECRFFFQYFKMYSANTDIEFKFGISVLQSRCRLEYFETCLLSRRDISSDACADKMPMCLPRETMSSMSRLFLYLKSC